MFSKNKNNYLIALTFIWILVFSQFVFPQVNLKGGKITNGKMQVTAPPTSLNKGFNFRSTDTFVTDGANTTYVRGGSTDAYPVTRNSVTFGWVANPSYPSDADRSSSGDARLAGINYQTNSGSAQPEFRVDLTATGTYTIHLALGDASFAQGYTYVQILDDTTVKVTIDKNTSIAANSFWDATGVTRTAANWPSQNVGVSVTFSTTILKIRVGSPTSQADSSCIAHMYID